jgi:peroxiredoxin
MMRSPIHENTTMTLQVGDRLPEATLTVIGDAPRPASTGELFNGRKVVLFCVPGAFTPTCSERHLPGYVEHFAAFRERGIDVACLAVNDAFVLKAWAQAQKVPAGLLMLADGNADFVRALGLEMDATKYGMGVRGKRFALYADDGIVKVLAVEAPGEFRVSGAEAMLAAI